MPGVQRYVLIRVGQSAILLIFVSMLTFALIHAAPGGPAILLAQEMTGEQIRQAQRGLGLDRPLPSSTCGGWAMSRADALVSPMGPACRCSG